MSWIYILIRYWVVRWFCPSVILSVRYRNHFSVVQFQNQAHIWNPQGTGHVFKTIWGAAGARIAFFFRRQRRRKLTPRPGRPRRPNLFYFLCSTAAEGGGLLNRRRRRPNEGAEGTTPLEGEGNPAEGGNFASLFLKFDEQKLLSFLMPCIC